MCPGRFYTYPAVLNRPVTTDPGSIVKPSRIWCTERKITGEFSKKRNLIGSQNESYSIWRVKVSTRRIISRHSREHCERLRVFTYAELVMIWWFKVISIDAQRYFWAHTFFTDCFYVVVCQLLTICLEISRNMKSGGVSVCECPLQNLCENNLQGWQSAREAVWSQLR